MPKVKDPSSGRFLPSRATLDKRSLDELARTLERFGANVDPRRIRTALDRTLEQLSAANMPSDKLQEVAAKRMETALRREMANTAKTYVRNAELMAHGLKGKGALSQKAVWVAVMDERTCDDCSDRHSEEETMRTWHGMGPPGSSNLICNGSCRCFLAPSAMVEGEEE